MSVNGVNGVNCENNNLYIGEHIYQKSIVYMFSRVCELKMTVYTVYKVYKTIKTLEK